MIDENIAQNNEYMEYCIQQRDSLMEIAWSMIKTYGEKCATLKSWNHAQIFSSYISKIVKARTEFCIDAYSDLSPQGLERANEIFEEKILKIKNKADGLLQIIQIKQDRNLFDEDEQESEAI